MKCVIIMNRMIYKCPNRESDRSIKFQDNSTHWEMEIVFCRLIFLNRDVTQCVHIVWTARIPQEFYGWGFTFYARGMP